VFKIEYYLAHNEEDKYWGYLFVKVNSFSLVNLVAVLKYKDLRKRSW
jgi:hypothetical protein